MILGLMRKHATSWLIKFIMAVIIVVFVLYFGYSFKAQRGLRIAKVNGDVITRAEYQNEYNRIYRMFKERYGEIWNERLSKVLNLKRMALQRLIDQMLMAQEAKRLGISVNATEIQRVIMKYPAFQTNGTFNLHLYKRLLRDNRMSPEEFENGIAKEILNNKLKEFILSFVAVTEQEALDYYTYTHEKIKISFVLFKPAMFKDKVKIKEDMIKKFFKKNRERYRVPEMIKCAYVVVDPKDFEDKVKPTEKDIKEYYEYHMDDYKLLGEKKPPPLKEVRDKVIRDLIQEHSTDLAQEMGYDLIDRMPYDIDLKDYAKDNGLEARYTDYFSLRDHSIPHIGGNNKVIQKLFELKGKDVSELIMIKGKFYIFQLADKKPSYLPELKQVLDQVREDLIDEMAMQEAKKAARSCLDKLRKGKGWKELAQENNLKIVYTDFFTRMEGIPKLGGTQELREILFSLKPGSRYPDKIYSTAEGAYIIRWEARKGIDKEEFKKEKVRLKLQLAYAKREQAFSAWLKGLRNKAHIELFGSIE